MKVLYLAPAGKQPGQLSRYSFLDEEIRALADAGIHAYVMSGACNAPQDDGRIHLRPIPRGSIAEWAKITGFLGRRLTTLPWANLADPERCQRALRIESAAAAVIRRENISLIHSYFGWPRGYGGLLAAAATGVPLVAGLRGADININPALRYGFRRTPSFDRAIRRLVQRADALIYVSEFLRRQAEALGARALVGCVILKGVRLDTFRPTNDRETLRAELGLGPEPMVLVVSGLVGIKGVEDILQALRRVRETGVPFTCVICGEGPLREPLEAQAGRLGLAGVVRFPGRVPRAQMPQLFAAADLFVHGALIEASGNVLLEAMAAGLPVVCTDAGGPAEYVRHGETGRVTPVSAPEALAEEIAMFLCEPETRKEYGHRARLWAEKSLSYERMIGETLEVYEEVSARRQSLPPTPCARRQYFGGRA